MAFLLRSNSYSRGPSDYGPRDTKAKDHFNQVKDLWDGVRTPDGRWPKRRIKT